VNRSTFSEWAAACQKSVTTFMTDYLSCSGYESFLTDSITTTETGLFMDLSSFFFLFFSFPILIRINYSMYAWKT